MALGAAALASRSGTGLPGRSGPRFAALGTVGVRDLDIRVQVLDGLSAHRHDEWG
jgi:hypothetical protein